MKVYTIIDTFSIADYAEPNECWVANYVNKEDAFKCFEAKLREAKAVGDDGKVEVDTRGNQQTVREAFEGMLADGFCLDTHNGKQIDRWFVRGQDVQTDFNAELIMWD